MWHYPAILHQDRVRRIYNNVQLRLPSAYAEEGSDSERLSEGRRSEAPSEDGALKAFRDCCNTSDTQKSLGTDFDANFMVLENIEKINLMKDMKD